MVPLFLSLLALLSSAAPPAGPAAAGPSAPVLQEPREDPEAGHVAAVDGLVERLLEHAAWCGEQRLQAKRADSYRLVLALRPDEARALRGLGYRRDREGRWIEPKNRVAPKDFEREALPEEARRRRAAVVPYRDRVLELVDAHAEDLADSRVTAWLDEILRVDPDDVRVHRRRGEVHSGEAWVLLETVEAREGRLRLKQAVKDAIESAAPAREVARLPREDSLGAGLDGPLANDVARALGGVPREELGRAIERVTAARTAVRELLSCEADYPLGSTLWLFPDRDAGRSWLARHPALDEVQRRFLGTLDGAGIQGSPDFAYWADDARRRVDGLVRVSIGWLLADGFGVTADHGWLFEGLGLYLTRELVGTRLTWFVQPSEYLLPEDEAALRAKLLAPEANWMATAQALLASERSPKLVFVLGKDVTRLTTEELLLSYVVCAYLLEARGAELPRLLARVGAGAPPNEALQETLGLDAMALDARARRWLSERR